ncbi:hypothetical protein K490DRAFT_40501, partial [Saccharata proteae CBS 121410]
EPVVKRPAGTPKTKKRSSLRLSFGPGESSPASGEDGGAVFTPKKSNLSRIALEKNAERKGLRASLPSDRIPIRTHEDEDRPSYSKDHLAELRNSTPSTPKDLASSRYESSGAIPTDAEIREKKERRARLAKEQDFMSLGDEPDDASDSDDLDRPRDVALRTELKEKYPETRLVHDDEDIAEGFDEYVEDGKVLLGRKAEREAERKRRAEMADMIASAEGGGSANEASEDDSEVERNEAYVAAQTRAGTYGSRDKTTNDDLKRPRTPPKITPVPDLSGVLARLRGSLKEMEEARASKIRRLEEVRAEKADIAQREGWVQQQLKETGEKYEKLRLEAGLGGGPGTPANGVDSASGARGLESLGATPPAVAVTSTGVSDASDGE